MMTAHIQTLGNLFFYDKKDIYKEQLTYSFKTNVNYDFDQIRRQHPRALTCTKQFTGNQNSSLNLLLLCRILNNFQMYGLIQTRLVKKNPNYKS